MILYSTRTTAWAQQIEALSASGQFMLLQHAVPCVELGVLAAPGTCRHITKHSGL
jgi:hypothetical protein